MDIVKQIINVVESSDPPLSNRKAGANVPDEPFGTKISAILESGIQYYWKKLENADGYEIYRSYSELGPFRMIKDIQTRRIGTYTDSTFDHNATAVYYKVRSYLQNGEERIYSRYSVARCAKCVMQVTLERETTYLYSGSKRKIRAIYGWGSVKDAVWQSSDEQVAVVSADGVIRGIAKGTADITCTSPSVGQSAVGKIVVDRAAPEPLFPITSRFSFHPESGCWVNEHAQKTNDAVIMMVGDLMCGKTQCALQYSEEEGYNFNDSYDYVKDTISSADFSVANLETLLASGWPYMVDEDYIGNTNNCNSPARYLDAVKYAGFDATMLSNNHNCDGGPKALVETIGQVDKYRFARTGAFLNRKEDRFFIADINGIKVGFLAYMLKSTGFNGKDKLFTAKEAAAHLNVFTPERAEQDIAKCREKGAEYVITYMHWGMKNFLTPTEQQYEEAQAIADAGTDLIIGANPHVLQPFDILTASSGKKVPCYYSTGNFQAVMNQVPGNRDSIIVKIRLQRDTAGQVVLAENTYIPCHTFKKIKKSNYAPLTLSETGFLGYKKTERKEIYSRIVEAIGSKVDPLE